MDLKGYKICGCLAVAENEQEAIDMYIQNTGEEPYKQPEETDLDEWFTYFNLDDIKEEDIPHIYDKKHPPNKPIQASLKRPMLENI
jgi:hypothetical protein